MPSDTGAAYKDGDDVRCGDCDKVALHERAGNEVVYMCAEHGWVATEFADSK
jgi:hypothetical protein